MILYTFSVYAKTFLNKNIDDKTINIDGYKIERKDRDLITSLPTDIGGGILMYIVQRHDLETEDIESVWIEVKIKQSNSFLVCSVYRPPSAFAD